MTKRQRITTKTSWARRGKEQREVTPKKYKKGKKRWIGNKQVDGEIK